MMNNNKILLVITIFFICSTSHLSIIQTATTPAPGGNHISSPPGGIRSFAFSQTGTQLAIGGADGTVSLFDITTGQQVLLIQAFDSAISSIEYLNNDTYLETKVNDGTIAIWRADTGDLVVTVS